MEIWFVRHGETESNRAGRWQGHGDSPLSATGRDQAAALARRIGHQHFDLVVSSDLSRAHDTARAVSHQVETDPQWRELDLGAWEGLTRGQVLERYPEQVDALRRGESVSVGGAESFDDLEARIGGALGRLRERLDEGSRALVVSHGGALSTAIGPLLGLSGNRRRRLGQLNNTAISVVRMDAAGNQLVRYNDATHVSPLAPILAEGLDHGGVAVSLMAQGSGTDRRRPKAAEWRSRLANEDALPPPQGGAPGWSRAAEEHPGKMVLVAVPPRQVADGTRLLMDISWDQGVLATPAEGSLSHLLWSSERPCLVDFNIEVEMEFAAGR